MRLLLSVILVGLQPAQAFAASAAPRVRVTPAAPNVRVGPLTIPQLTTLPTLGPSAVPTLNPAAVPTLTPTVSPAVTPFQASIQKLSAETLIPQQQAATSGDVSQGARADFEQRIGLESGAEVSGGGVEGVEAPSVSGLSKPAKTAGAPKTAKAVAKPEKIHKEARSPYFLAAVAVVFGALGGSILGLTNLFTSAAQNGGGSFGVDLGLAVLAGAGAAAASSVIEAGIFAYTMWKGRNVTDEQFRGFLRTEVLNGRLDGGVAELIKVHRPKSKKDLDFGYVAGGRIYLRPELAATPFLFRQVMLHELSHLHMRKERGPPRGRVATLVRGMVSEVKARVSEFGGVKKLQKVRVPVLERVLRQAQLSMNLGRPYEVLVVNATSPELTDAKLYGKLSGGAARVEAAQTKTPHDILSKPENARRFTAVVLDRSHELLPKSGTQEALKLEMALQQLDDLYLLATRMQAQQGSLANPKYRELAEKAAKIDKNNLKAVQNFERQVRQAWREIAGVRLKGVGAASLVDKLYAGLQNKGVGFLSFGPTDPGVMTWERLLRFWEAEDGGQFRVTRVDLESGAHVLVLRKIESRVGLWLKPQNGGHIDQSVPNASATEAGRAEARAALVAAGLEKHLEKLDSLDVEIKHVFGADVGRQEIYVTIPRRNQGAIRGLVSGTSITITKSENAFKPEGLPNADLHDVKPLWRMGVTGKGGKIMWIDTGADATHEDFAGRLETIDMVGEGPEDWMGHGSHVAGISISGHDKYTGLAKEAQGVMAKVFSRDAAGAADGDIMAAGAEGVKRGVNVINLSLGSRGSSSDNLAIFFSELSRKSGIFVTASQGNSGPFDRTGSQPAQGDGVFAVTAGGYLEAAKARIVRFFGSVGPDIDLRYSIRRLRIKPDVTVNGGNVTTKPGSKDVYEEGVTSTKSKDSPRSASDTEDGRHTRLSGTSMASPALAAVAMLIMMLGLRTPYYDQNKPAVIGALLKRTAEDMALPAWHQGAGWVTAWGAAKLVFAEAGMKLRRWFRGEPNVDPWAWVKRYEDVTALEDTIYSSAEVARSQAESRFEDGATEDSETPQETRADAAQAVQNEVMKKFDEAAEKAVPRLVEMLKDPIWLVRRQAALVLMNLKHVSAAMPLAEAALKDEDPRVRQMAYMALGELNTHSVDVLLKQAAGTSVYAAYALARHGDGSEIPRISAALSSQNIQERYTAAWLLGQLDRRATGEVSEQLSSKVKDTAEFGEVRHLSGASLFNIASRQPGALSDKAILDLLEASGPQNLALTRTIAKIFPAAAQNKAFAARLREAPLKQPVTDWVLQHKEHVMRPGALGEMVTLLARIAGIQLDTIDPAGTGVPGVDPALGSVDVIVVPAGGKTVEAAWLARFEAQLTASTAGGLVVTVPQHKFFALLINLQQDGHAVRVPYPVHPVKKWEKGTGIEITEKGRLVELTVRSAVSEGALLAALEKYRGKNVVVSLSGVSVTPGPLSRMISLMTLTGTGVVVPAGNMGPADGSISPLARSLSVSVAEPGPQSGRASPDQSILTWSDAGGSMATAVKLAQLAERLEQALGSLPDGWFQYVVAVARRSLSPIDGQPPHAVGAGLYDKPEVALALLEQKLQAPEQVKNDAATLAESMRKRQTQTRPEAQPTAFQRAKKKFGLLAFDDLSIMPEAGRFDAAELKSLKRVMGDGTDGIEVFNFRLPEGKWWQARDAGLEGFLYTKLEVERDHGASVEQLSDYFKYLDALLTPAPWTQQLRESLAALQAEDIPDFEKNRRLNALLVSAVNALRARHAQLDRSVWGRKNATYMIFARAYNRLKPGKNFFGSLDDAELLRIKNDLKATEIWPMGIFEIGEQRRWGTGGGSLYSIKGYQIMESLGGEAGFKALVLRAHKLGLKVKVDFIPNHTSLDSRMIKEQPTAFMHIVPPQHLSDEEIMAALPRETAGEKYPFWYLIRANDGKRYLIHHPRTDYGEVMWVDLAQIDYSRPEAQEFQKAELRRLLLELGVDSVRRDMAYEVVNARFYQRWKTILEKELEAPQADWVRQATKAMLAGFLERGKTAPEFLEAATDEVKAAKPTTVMIDEVYANLEAVSRTGSDGLYDKIGLYDALVSRDAKRIRAALRHSAYKRWQRGAAPYVNFIGTHDGGEGNPFDKFGKQIKAAAATALLLRPILLYNGVEQGVGQRANVIGDLDKSVDREKALPYDVPVQINWANADASNQAMLKAVLAAGDKHQELLDKGAMEVLEPAHETPVTAYAVGLGAGRPALIVASNWSDNPASGVFRFEKPILKDFEAFTPDRHKRYKLTDLTNGAVYERLGQELADSGLYVHLPAGGAHIFEVTELEAAPTTGPPSAAQFSKASGAQQVKVHGTQAVEVDPTPEQPAKKARTWDDWTSWLASKAGWVFTFLQAPQIYKNVVNLSGGHAELLAGLPWMGYSTGILANMLLLGYFAGKKEKSGAFVQGIGVVTSAVVIVQIFLAGFMPLWAFAAVMPTIVSGLVVNWLAYKGKLPEKVGKVWNVLSSSLGLFVLPQAVLSAFIASPLIPGLISTAVLFGAMWKFPKFKQLVSALTATALFTYGPIAQMIVNVTNPASMAGIAVLSLMLGTLGNLLMLPRAMHTKDWIWFFGSAWGVAMGGWATMLCMYLAGYLGAALFWPVTLLIPAYLLFAYNMSRKK